jgi:hypothetical protein
VRARIFLKLQQKVKGTLRPPIPDQSDESGKDWCLPMCYEESVEDSRQKTVLQSDAGSGNNNPCPKIITMSYEE